MIERRWGTEEIAGTKPLTTLPIYIFKEFDDIENQKHKFRDLIDISFGNSGLSLHYHIDLRAENSSQKWIWDFRPEFNILPDPENRIKYSRMFAAGFIEMIKYLTSDLSKENPKLFSILSEHKLETIWSITNPALINFRQRVIGEEYYVKDKINYSGKTPREIETIKEFISINGYPCTFYVKKFLEDYKKNPKLLEACEKLADPKKLAELKVKEIN